MTVYIADMSNYDWQRDADHSINFRAVRADGISGIQHKATEGHTYTDPHFGDFARLVDQGVGFALVGPYHVLWPGDPKADADHWFDTVDRLMPWWRDYPGVVNWQIDAEKFDGMPREPNLSEVHACADRIMARGGNDLPAASVVVYAPKWLYGDSLRGLRFKLWSSSYGSNPAVRYRAAYPGDNGAGWAPYSGVTPSLWQYGSRTIIGEQSTCDASAVRVADEAALQTLFGGKDVPLTNDDVNKIWTHPVKNPKTGVVQSAEARLLGAQAHAGDALDAANAANKTAAAAAAKVAALAALIGSAGGLDEATMQRIADAAAAKAVDGLTVTINSQEASQ